MGEFVILMGKDQKDYFEAALQHQINPTQESKSLLDKLSAENTQRLNKSQQQASEEFIFVHGKPLYEFIKSISKKYFLVGKYKPFHLSWDVKEEFNEEGDSENDNYRDVSFYNNQFNYRIQYCGGYAGSKIIEENISQQRIIELIKAKA